MTNRRSIPADAARYSRQTQFTPGHVGGRVASAQPVRSRRTIGTVTTPPATPIPIYWWTFDEASGDEFVDSVNAFSLYAGSTLPAGSHHVTALAPDSTYALKLWETDFESSVELTGYESTDQSAVDFGPDGLIVFDFWISGVENSDGVSNIFQAGIPGYGGPPYPYLWMAVNNTGTSVTFGLNYNVTQATITWSYTGATHIRWELSATASRILINDAEVANDAYTILWDATHRLELAIGRSTASYDVAAALTVDELKIYGTRVVL